MMLSNWKHVENLETLRESVDNTDDNCIDLGCRDAQNDYKSYLLIFYLLAKKGNLSDDVSKV